MTVSGRASRATLDFSASAPGASSFLTFTGQSAGQLPSYYTVNGQDFAAYSSTAGVAAVTNYQVNTFASGGNVKIDPSVAIPAAPTSVGSVAIDTLNLAAGNSSINIVQNGGIVTLNSGGLIKSGTGSAVLGGNSVPGGAPGFLTSNSGELDVFVKGGPSNLPLTYAGQIIGNLDLVKSGGGTLVLGSGATDAYSNAFTGTVYVNGGLLLLNKADGTNAIPGSVNVNGGTPHAGAAEPDRADGKSRAELGRISGRRSTADGVELHQRRGNFLDRHGAVHCYRERRPWRFVHRWKPRRSHGVGGNRHAEFRLEHRRRRRDRRLHDLEAQRRNKRHQRNSLRSLRRSAFPAGASLTLNAGATPGKLLFSGGSPLTVSSASTTASILSSAPTNPGMIDLLGHRADINVGAGVSLAGTGGTISPDLLITAKLTNGALQKLGPGVLRLGAANSYAGGTTIAAGVLEITDPAALGTGTVFFGGGSGGSGLRVVTDSGMFVQSTLSAIGSTANVDAVTKSVNAVAVTLGATTLGPGLNVTGSSSNINLHFGKVGVPVTLSSSVVVNNTTPVFFDGAINGGSTMVFTKTGAGAITFTGTDANNYGSTVVNQGLLVLAKSPGTVAAGAMTINDGMVQLRHERSDCARQRFWG